MSADKRTIAFILADAQLMSFTLVARKYGMTRNQVAGIVWRAKNPHNIRVSSPNGNRNKVGRPYRGPGLYPILTEQNSR